MKNVARSGQRGEARASAPLTQESAPLPSHLSAFRTCVEANVVKFNLNLACALFFESGIAKQASLWGLGVVSVHAPFIPQNAFISAGAYAMESQASHYDVGALLLQP